MQCCVDNCEIEAIDALFTSARSRGRLSEIDEAKYRAKTRELKKGQAA